jgi:lysophospholipase L1-like esterase
VRLRSAACLIAVLAAACGASPSPSPGDPTEPTYTVTALVYYDENGNGQLDAAEAARVPGAEVVVGSSSGRSAPGSGQALVSGVRAGTQAVGLRLESLPFFFVPGASVSIDVPTPAEVRLGVTLPIGDNFPNVYLGVGDSITAGQGSTDGQGYVLKLQNLLAPHFARAQVVEEGRTGGAFSIRGAQTIATSLGRQRPAYTLIHYGTNDWNDQGCQPRPPAECFTIDSFRTMVFEVKHHSSLPVLATIIPANPAIESTARNAWIDGMNILIKALAREEGALIADLNAAFRAEPSLPALFDDHVHPNDRGYEVMAQGFFRAITQSRSAAAAATRSR